MTVAKLVRWMKKHHRGGNRAKPNSHLAVVFGFTDLGTNGRHGLKNSAALTTLFWKCVDEGHPICSNDNGYFYATTRTEILASVRRLERLSVLYSDRADKLSRAGMDLPY